MTFVLSESNLVEFAKATGDQNSIHTDLESAKEIGCHAPVVHGAMLILFALGWRIQRGDRPAVSCSARFYAPVFANERFVLRDNEANTVGIYTQNQLCAEIQVSSLAAAVQVSVDETLNIKRLVEWHGPAVPAPLSVAMISWAGLGWYNALGAVSYFVGMIDPGQYGLISELQLSWQNYHEHSQSGNAVSLLSSRAIAGSKSHRSLICSTITGAVKWLAKYSAVRPVNLGQQFAIETEITPRRTWSGAMLTVGASRGLGAALCIRGSQIARHSVGLYRDSVRSAHAVARVAEEKRLPLTMLRVDCSDETAINAVHFEAIFGQMAPICIFLAAFPPPSFERHSEHYEALAIALATYPLRAIIRRKPDWIAKIVYISSTYVGQAGARSRRYADCKKTCELAIDAIMSEVPRAALLIARVPIFLSSRTALVGSLRRLPNAMQVAGSVMDATVDIEPGRRQIQTFSWS